MAVNKLYPVDEKTGRAYKVEDVSAEYGSGAWQYSDGSIRGEGGKLITKLYTPSPITHENAREYQAKAIMRKYQIMAQAANSEVQDPALIAEYGDMAHVAERAITLQRIATTPEAGKAAIMAHDALIRDTGMGERTTAHNEQVGARVVAQAIGDMVLESVWRDVMQARANAIDAEVIPIRSDSTDDAE